MSTTWDEVELVMWNKPWFSFSKTHEFSNVNFRPRYYRIREEYSISRAITVEQFEAGYTLSGKDIEIIADRIFLDFMNKDGSFRFSVTVTLKEGRLSYRGLMMSIVSRMTWILLIIPGLITSGMLTVGKQTAFGAWIATLSENRDLLIDYTDKLKAVDYFNNTALIPFFWTAFSGSVKLFDDSLNDIADCYRVIAESFQYLGAYRLQGIVESRDDNATVLSVLPDKNDRIEFPTRHLPDDTDIGSIVTIEISKYDSSDITRWTRFSEKVVNVHDGDTITLASGKKIRILPINAPELKNPDGSANPAGIVSQNILSSMVLDRVVDCYVDPSNPTDAFGRTLAYVYRDGVDMGQWMMDNGYAVLYRVTNSWFVNLCIGNDSKYTYLEPLDELSDLSPGRPAITIRIPNYFMPFVANFAEIIYIRARASRSLSYKTAVTCFAAPAPGYAELRIETDKTKVIKVDLPLLKRFIPEPCDKRIRVGLKKYYPCDSSLTAGEAKALYDHIDGVVGYFTSIGPDAVTYSITVPVDKVPANVDIGDELIFTFTEILPYVILTAEITDIISPTVMLVHGTTPPYNFSLDQSLIPFPIAAGDKIGIEVGKNIGTYYVADFHARLGNNTGGIANFVKLPEETLAINLPLPLVDDIVQDPAEQLDRNKIQVNDNAYFKILDRSFTNSFYATLDRIEGANGIWKLLPDQKTEIVIPSTVAEEYLTTQKYSEYPTMTFSIKLLSTQLIYDANQEIEVISTDVNNTTIKFLHLHFGFVQATIPARLFSWLPAVGDHGIFKMTNYTGLDSESMYVDSISESEARLVSTTKKDISMHYPIDKLPLYLKRFDTVRLQIRTNGWTKVPSGTVAQDVIDKYTNVKTLKSGAVKRTVPATIPDTLNMFATVTSLDDGYANAIAQRTDNGAWLSIPVYILPRDTDVGDTLCLNAGMSYYRETYFKARFMSLTLPDICSFLVIESMNFPFTVPLTWIPATSVINGDISFRFTKKTAGDTFAATHKITVITATDITMQGLSEGKTATFDRALLPYVTLPPPNDDITNLQVGTEFRLVTKKIS